MYTRNYRIQRGDRAVDVSHSDAPFSETSHELTPKPENDLSEPVCEGISDENPHDQPLMDVSDQMASSQFPEPHTDEHKRGEAQELTEDVKPPMKKLRAVKRFRVRSSDSCPTADEDVPPLIPLASPPLEEPAEERADEYCDERAEAPSEKPPRREPDRHFDKHTGKKGFGLPSLGFKNFSTEDIFLCAIMLLLINEGCEDIMILILGFLLIS